MSAKMWKADDYVVEMMQDLVGKYHPMLANVDKQIAIIFKEKASKAGGMVILGKSKKAPELVNVLGDKEYIFVIELASKEWMELTEKQRIALLDHHLCACRVEEDSEKDGDLKCYIAPPDFSAYFPEIERHGVWRDAPEEASDGASVIEDLFAKKEKPEEDGEEDQSN